MKRIKILLNDDFNRPLFQADRLKVSDQEEDNDINSLRQEVSEIDLAREEKASDIIDVESSLNSGAVKRKNN